MPDAEAWAQTWLDDHRNLMSQDDAAPPEPTPSEESTAKMYDAVTAGFVNDTPDFSEIAQAIAATPRINPLSVMRGQQRQYELLPTVIWKAQRAASVKERAQLMALLQDQQAHEMQKERFQSEQEKILWDRMRQTAAQGNSAVGAVYKTFTDMSKNLDNDRANAWLNEIMHMDVSQGIPDEATGRAMALAALQRVGGVQATAKPPMVRTIQQGGENVTVQWTGTGWEEIGGGPRWKAPTAKTATRAAGKTSPERLYQVQGPGGQIVYQPREAAIGQPAAALPRTRAVGATGAAKSARPSPAAAGPPQVKSDADYARLPSGTVFVDPDGRRRRKP